MNTSGYFPIRRVAITWIAFVVAALPLAAGSLNSTDARPRRSSLFAAAASNEPLATSKTPRSIEAPVTESTKTKARFLGAFGLVIISILVLATGIALLRTFRQR
jgi:hypothetical protein